MKIAYMLVTCGVIVVLNALIAQKEHLVRTSPSVYLELAPADPRSLMQGDYMRLNYSVSNQIRSEIHNKNVVSDGIAIVSIDDRGVGRFSRIDDGQPLAANERRLQYRKRQWQTRIGAESYFFQEGHADRFQKAKYGELKVSSNGECVLVGLRDEHLQPI